MKATIHMLNVSKKAYWIKQSKPCKIDKLPKKKITRPKLDYELIEQLEIISRIFDRRR